MNAVFCLVCPSVGLPPSLSRSLSLYVCFVCCLFCHSVCCMPRCLSLLCFVCFFYMSVPYLFFFVCACLPASLHHQRVANAESGGGRARPVGAPSEGHVRQRPETNGAAARHLPDVFRAQKGKTPKRPLTGKNPFVVAPAFFATAYLELRE